jgi:hypothetical protein
MGNLLLATFFLCCLSVVIFVELMIRKGKLLRVGTYSYKVVVIRSIIHLFIALLISLITYLISGSSEVTIPIAVLLVFGVLGGLLYGLVWEHQASRGGAKKSNKGEQERSGRRS